MPHVRSRTSKHVPGTVQYLRRRPCIWVSTTDTTVDDGTDAGLDLVAVERAANGREPLPRLTRSEKRIAVRAMRKAGVSLNVMAARTGVTQRTIARWVSELGDAA